MKIEMKDTFTPIYTALPERTPNTGTPDGAVSGNGDLGLVWGGKPSELKLFISKLDAWNTVQADNLPGGISPVAVLTLQMPYLFYSDYYVEQRMKQGEIYGKFSDGVTTAEVRSIVCACENTVILELKFTGKSIMSHSVMLKEPENPNSTFTNSETHGDISILERGWAGDGRLFDTYTITTLKQMPKKTEGDSRIYTYVLNIATNHDCQSYRADTIRKAEAYSFEDISLALMRHNRYWKKFWDKSEVVLDDKLVELFWNGGLYLVACCTGNRNFAPGLYGNYSTTDTPNWHGDLHLNYNYQAPFYALTSSNHPELMDCYDKSVEEFVPIAEKFAHDLLGCRGVYFPVGIGPFGLKTSHMPYSIEHEEGFLGQKSNGNYTAVDMIMRWKGTMDEDYAADHLYPFLLKLADFWEDYLSFEDGRYVIYNDCIHEEPYYSGRNFKPEHYNDFNPILELGFIRMLFSTIIAVSETLGVDEDRREKWNHILTHISDYPTMEKNGKTVFRLTEKGLDWVDGNFLVMQHMYPAGMIGQDSDKKLLEIAKDSFWMTERWEDSNAFCSYYPCAVRLGVDSDLVLDKINNNVNAHGYPSTFFDFGGGGIENCAAIPVTVNEMLLQSFEGVVRIFPNWNRNRNASFKNLRADGAFLVTASCSDGVVTGEIFSEKGLDLTVQNPYSDRKCSVISHTGKVEIEPEGRVTLKTFAGETLKIG